MSQKRTKPETSGKRQKRYSNEQVKQFELAGGAEAGMPAGEAGGPGENDQAERRPPNKDKDR